MKDTSHPEKHHEDRLFLRQTSSAPLQKDKAGGGVAGRSFGVGRGYGERTYTLRVQNVYVLLAIRIRLDEKGYTFGPRSR